MNRARKFMLLMVLGAMAGAAGAMPASSDARAELQAQLEATSSFRARFSQRVTDADGRLVEEGAGEFWLARPDRFRWEYAEPFPRLLIADGQRVWLYDPELEQVTVRDLDGLLDKTPAALLAGNIEQLDAYTISGERDGAILAVQLTPVAARSDFKRIDMAFVDNQLSRLELLDQFGQLTRIDFVEAVSNPGIDPSRFAFRAPAGTDIIDESSR